MVEQETLLSPLVLSRGVFVPPHPNDCDSSLFIVRVHSPSDIPRFSKQYDYLLGRHRTSRLGFSADSEIQSFGADCAPSARRTHFRGGDFRSRNAHFA